MIHGRLISGLGLSALSASLLVALLGVVALGPAHPSQAAIPDFHWAGLSSRRLVA